MRSPLSSRPTKFKPAASSSPTSLGFTSYRCRCLSDTRAPEGRGPFPPGQPYSKAAKLGSPGAPLVGVCSTVSRAPRRMVPPMSPSLSISGMNTTAGCGVASSNSVECAPSLPKQLRAYSTTSICMPKHTPKYGTLFVRAKLAVRTMPSTPRWPKPPGTMIPSAALSLAHASSCATNAAAAAAASCAPFSAPVPLLLSVAAAEAVPTAAVPAAVIGSRAEDSTHTMSMSFSTSHAACLRLLSTER
mmetsp:Transcript_70739/g.139035  ORF Transcript_70739/g.139035 Transcript_70739/m.139035 type:complete len:245 (-) Transcript_70739:1010-1744(-)